MLSSLKRLSLRHRIAISKDFQDICSFFPNLESLDLNDERPAPTGNDVTVSVKLLRHQKSFLNVQECSQCTFSTIPVGLIPQLDRDFVCNIIVIRNMQKEHVTPKDLKLLLENFQTELIRLHVKVLSSWLQVSKESGEGENCPRQELQLYQMNMVLESWIAGRNRDMEIGEFEHDKFSDLNREIISTNIGTHATQLTEAEMDSLFESDALRTTVIEATTRLHQE